ncbi:MAG: DUF1801 domain-containing protein [Ginsengibacter sp.]
MIAEKILSGYDEKISALAFQLREFLFSELKNISEEADAKAGIIGYNYGKGYKNLICVILLSKKNVKLGFYKGSELPDPEKLLTGTGKVHRFVEIKSAQNISNPALKQLLQEAVAAHTIRKEVT